MTFYSFMMKYHRGQHTPAGDLAEDMYDDKELFPRNRSCKFAGWHNLILGHLKSNDACNECIAVFEECWKDYVACERKRLKRNS